MNTQSKKKNPTMLAKALDQVPPNWDSLTPAEQITIYKKKSKEHPQLAFIEKTLINKGFIFDKKAVYERGYTKEYKFLATRKFRADIAFSCGKGVWLVEYEGIFASKSRHTTVTGYSKDSDKYNLATIWGFFVLRYTAINFRLFEKHLEIILDNSK